MKKNLCIVLAVMLAVSALAGCGVKNPKEDKLNVVCTIFPQYDFVREIAGDSVNVSMLVPAGMESHDFRLENLNIHDMNTVNKADLFICVGGETDSGWVNELLDTVSNKDISVLKLTEMTELLPVASSESMAEHEHEHEDEDERGDEHCEEDEADEHVWTSPRRASEIVVAITEQLKELDSKNAEKYISRCNEYVKNLNKLDSELKDVVSKAQEKTLVFADRFPFRYLCSDYGLGFDAAFSGCSATADPSVLQITSLCKTASDAGAKVIFHMENSNTSYAEMIADKVGAKVLLLHSCHTVTKAELSDGVTYLSLMENNIKNISEALL